MTTKHTYRRGDIMCVAIISILIKLCGVSMKVDFNNIRVQAVRNYNRLTEILNEKINSDGVIESFDADEIQNAIDGLRTNLVIIAASFDEGNDDFIDVAENLTFIDFNPVIYKDE